VAYYMPQELFNCTVLALALGNFLSEEKPEVRSVLHEGLRVYLDFYTEDDFLPDAEDCAARTLGWIRGQTSNGRDMTFAWLTALNDAVLQYEPSGEPKPQRSFDGLAQASSQQPVPDRPLRYFKDLGLYYLNIQFEKIPQPGSQASKPQSGFDGLFQKLDECLSQYIFIHDDVWAVDLRRIIPIPLVFKPVKFGQHADALQEIFERLAILGLSFEALNPPEVDIPLTYIKLLCATVQKLRVICLGGEDIVNGKPHKWGNFNSDVDEYEQLVEAYSSMGYRLNNWMKSFR
jgi:hypothetical protein